MFLQLLMPKNEFFEQFCAFFVVKNFFMRFLVFAVKVLENPQNLIFSKKSAFFEKMRFREFSRAFTANTKSPMKKFPRQKRRKIAQRTHFFALKG